MLSTLSHTSMPGAPLPNLSTGLLRVAQNPMLDELYRLESFPLHTMHIGGVSKIELAKKGFYFSNNDVKCAFCCKNVPLSNLSNPQHNANCPMQQGTAAENNPLDFSQNYRMERHRLASFLQTPWTAPVAPDDLAKWGFYWSGSCDVGRCHFCRLEVRGWEPGDTGEGEHRRWNPNCPFLQGRSVGNVRLGEELERQIVNDRGVVALQQHQPQVNPAKHTKYVAMESRLQTFATWPLSLSQRPRQLAQAGFYYTGSGDRVICHHCGGGLKDWGWGDQPWVEHAVQFPTCQFLIQNKGREFVNQVQDAKKQQNQAQSAPQQVVATPVSRDVSSSGTDDKDLTCKVCYEGELSIVFLPCGHLSTCGDCAPQLIQCPMCREKISAYIRAVLPHQAV